MNELLKDLRELREFCESRLDNHAACYRHHTKVASESKNVEVLVREHIAAACNETALVTFRQVISGLSAILSKYPEQK